MGDSEGLAAVRRRADQRADEIMNEINALVFESLFSAIAREKYRVRAVNKQAAVYAMLYASDKSAEDRVAANSVISHWLQRLSGVNPYDEAAYTALMVEFMSEFQDPYPEAAKEKTDD